MFQRSELSLYAATHSFRGVIKPWVLRNCLASGKEFGRFIGRTTESGNFAAEREMWRLKRQLPNPDWQTNDCG